MAQKITRKDAQDMRRMQEMLKAEYDPLLTKYMKRLQAHDGKPTYLTQVDDRDLLQMLNLIEWWFSDGAKALNRYVDRIIELQEEN